MYAEEFNVFFIPSKNKLIVINQRKGAKLSTTVDFMKGCLEVEVSDVHLGCLHKNVSLIDQISSGVKDFLGKVSMLTAHSKLSPIDTMYFLKNPIVCLSTVAHYGTWLTPGYMNSI